jgi:polyhydroxybutyrate depolymerase
MKTKDLRKFILIGCIFLQLLSSCRAVLSGDPTPQPTAILTPTVQSRNIKHTIPVEDAERNYWLHEPSDLEKSQPVPLVVVLHGIGSKPQYMFRSGFNDIADQEKFLVLYPELMDGDSTVLIEDFLNDVEESYTIDSSRVFITGFSLGGKRSYRAACIFSDRFAAIAPVSGAGECTDNLPDHPVSVLHIHGLADNDVPFQGGGNANHPAVEDIIGFWVGFNDCQNFSEETKDGAITHKKYTDCEKSTAVELITIDTLAHNWPEREIAAADIIWDFFMAHPKP